MPSSCAALLAASVVCLAAPRAAQAEPSRAPDRRPPRYAAMLSIDAINLGAPFAPFVHVTTVSDGADGRTAKTPRPPRTAKKHRVFYSSSLAALAPWRLACFSMCRVVRPGGLDRSSTQSARTALLRDSGRVAAENPPTHGASVPCRHRRRPPGIAPPPRSAVAGPSRQASSAAQLSTDRIVASIPKG